MPERVMPLTKARIEQAVAREKPYKLFGGEGLYIQVLPSVNKTWRMRYRQKSGLENLFSFGRYPDISIGKVRE